MALETEVTQFRSHKARYNFYINSFENVSLSLSRSVVASQESPEGYRIDPPRDVPSGFVVLLVLSCIPSSRVYAKSGSHVVTRRV